MAKMYLGREIRHENQFCGLISENILSLGKMSGNVYEVVMAM